MVLDAVNPPTSVAFSFEPEAPMKLIRTCCLIAQDTDGFPWQSGANCVGLSWMARLGISLGLPLSAVTISVMPENAFSNVCMVVVQKSINT